MSPTTFEDDVRTMLRRRATDIPGGLAEGLDEVVETDPAAVVPIPLARSARLAAPAPPSDGPPSDGPPSAVAPSDGPPSAAPPVPTPPATVLAGADPEPAPRRPAWILVAAALLVVLPLVALLTVRQEEPPTLQTAPTPGTDVPVPVEMATVDVAIEVEQPSPVPLDAGISIRTARPDGTIGSWPTGGLRVFDPWAEPGAPGNVLVARRDPFSLPLGEVSIEVRLIKCLGDPCWYDDQDTSTLVCTGVIDVQAPGVLVTARFASDGSCLSVHEGWTQEQDDRALALLEHQKATGWVPYAGDEVVPGRPTPDDAWVPATFGGQPGCELPPALADDRGTICVFDAPAGNVIGYAVSNLGYVPVDLVGTLDVDATVEDRYGCNPRNDDACVQRWIAAMLRAELERPDLTEERRREITDELAEFDQYLTRTDSTR